MDVTIQSQLQSPLVRTLQSIPTNSSNFLHGIPDNTPPHSRSNIKVQPYFGSEKNLTGQQKFKIPQQGHLSRMYLIYRMIGHFDTNNDTIQHASDNVFSFGDGIEWIQLRSHNNVIETLYASAIPFEVSAVTNSEQTLKTTMQGLAGYTGSSAGAIVEPPVYGSPTLVGAGHTSMDWRLSVKDYLVPLPFSSTVYMKDNFQTRQLEDLELVVQFRLSPTQYHGSTAIQDIQSKKDLNEVTLSIDYINYHENVEEVIRNENFKPNVPAVLLQKDFLMFKAQHVSSKDVGPSLLGNESLYSVALNTDAYVSDIFIVPRVVPTSKVYGRYESLGHTGLTFTLKTASNVLFESTKVELDGFEGMHYSTVTRQYQNEGVLPLRWNTDGTRIRLSLNNTDEFNDGGISFQSLVNPVLEIRAVIEKDNPTTIHVDVGDAETTTLLADPDVIEFDVVLKRRVMLRIDGNTGKIQKSLES